MQGGQAVVLVGGAVREPLVGGGAVNHDAPPDAQGGKATDMGETAGRLFADAGHVGKFVDSEQDFFLIVHRHLPRCDCFTFLFCSRIV